MPAFTLYKKRLNEGTNAQHIQEKTKPVINLKKFAGDSKQPQQC